MRLSRRDFVPLLTIVAGGVIGASLSFGLLGSRSEDVSVAVPVSATYESVEVFLRRDGLKEALRLQERDGWEERAERIRLRRRADALARARSLVRERAGAPVSYSAVAPPDSGDLLACATQQLRAMRYNDMMRAFTYVRARKDTDRVADDEKNSALNVTIAGQTMHVTAGVITKDKWDMGHGAELMGSPSSEARGDAQRLLTECAGSAGVIQAI